MQHSNGNPMAAIAWDYDEVLEKIGFGKTQLILLLISGLMTITSVAAQQAIGIIVIASQCEFETSQAEKGVMLGANVAGVVLSTYIWGYISDAIGRRTVLLYGIFVSNFLHFILMFVTSVWLFNIINLLTGISLGGISAALYAYISEFNIPRHRAIVINYSTMFVSITAIYVPATAWLMLSSTWSINIVGDFIFRPWRLIILLNLLPGFIGGLMLLPFPESPKLLLAQKKTNKAVDAVAWISKFNLGKPIERVLECDELVLKPEMESDEEVATPRLHCGMFADIARATVPLFHKPHGFNFVLSIFVVLGMFFSSNGVQFWFPEIVNRSSNYGSPATVCDILTDSFEEQKHNASVNATLLCDDTISTKTYIDNMIVGIAFFIGFFIQGLLLNPVGRKNVLMAALTIATLCGILIHMVTNGTGVLILFCLYILLPGLSISIMLGAIVDFLPTHLRGKAVSLCMTLGRIGIILAANLIGVLLETFCNTTFAIFTIVIFACLIIVFYLPIRNIK